MNVTVGWSFGWGRFGLGFVLCNKQVGASG